MGCPLQKEELVGSVLQKNKFKIKFNLGSDFTSKGIVIL